MNYCVGCRGRLHLRFHYRWSKNNTSFDCLLISIIINKRRMWGGVGWVCARVATADWWLDLKINNERGLRRVVWNIVRGDEWKYVCKKLSQQNRWVKLKQGMKPEHRITHCQDVAAFHMCYDTTHSFNPLSFATSFCPCNYFDLFITYEIML